MLSEVTHELVLVVEEAPEDFAGEEWVIGYILMARSCLLALQLLVRPELSECSDFGVYAGVKQFKKVVSSCDRFRGKLAKLVVQNDALGERLECINKAMLAWQTHGPVLRSHMKSLDENKDTVVLEHRKFRIALMLLDHEKYATYMPEFSMTAFRLNMDAHVVELVKAFLCVEGTEVATLQGVSNMAQIA